LLEIGEDLGISASHVSRIWKTDHGSGKPYHPVAPRPASIVSEMPPLISHEVIIHLICGDHVRDSLEVKSARDLNSYRDGIKISDQQVAELRLKRDAFRGDWNYSLLPRS
jgi:hypothetical protein